MTDYQRPQLTEQQIKDITTQLRKGLATKTHFELKNLIIAMALENSRLCLEINEHRIVLGIEPLPTYTPKS